MYSLSDILKVSGLLFLAQFLIVGAIYFTNGMLTPVWAQSLPYAARLLIVSLTAILLANLLYAYTFGNFQPGLAAPITMVSTVIIQVIFAVLVFKLKPPVMIIPATLLVAASAAWVSVLLGQAK